MSGKKLDLIGQKFGRLTVIKFAGKRNGLRYFLCECECGTQKEILASCLPSGNSKSCGCYQRDRSAAKGIDLTNKRFGRLVVLSLCDYKKHGKRVYRCKCDCDNIVEIVGNNLTSKTRGTKSCGCYLKEILKQNNRGIDLTGRQFGSLTVLYLKKERKRYGKGCLERCWVCECKCKRKTELTSKRLIQGSTQSCGNCGLWKNGKRISRSQIKLRDKIGRGELNYKIGEYCVDIAFLSSKILLEYDEWFWHGFRIEQDKERVQKLLDMGWKVISVKASNNLPTQEQIDNAFTCLDSGANHVIILLDGWGKKDTFQDVRNKKKNKVI